MTELTDAQIARLIGATHSTDVPTRYIRLMAAEIAHRRNMEKNMEQRPSFGSSHIDQPREAKPMNRISDSEIRLKVLESREFAYAAGEKLRDELTNEQAAVLGYYLFTNPSNENLAKYCMEVIYPILSKVLYNEIEDYKDKNSIAYEPGDCSAFEE
jgi:hypothetical protein